MDQVVDSAELSKLKLLMQHMLEPDDAAIFASSIGQSQNIRVVTLPLDTAKPSTQPLDLGFPFRSLYVVSATDNAVSVNMRLESIDSSNDSFPIKSQTSFKLPFPVRRAYLDWSAQSGKTITILFALRGEFSTNQIAAITSGGIFINDGDTVTTQTKATVTTSSAQLFAADSTRKKMVIQNQGSVSIYVGDANVTIDTGTNPGIEVPPGATYLWSSTGACYAIAKGASNANISVTKFN